MSSILNISSYREYVGQPHTTRPESLICLPFVFSLKFRQSVYPCHTDLEGITEALLGEMLLEWNIRGAIIEPGEPGTSLISNADKIPQHSPYTGDTPSPWFRTMLETDTLMRNKEKTAQPIFEVSQAQQIYSEVAVWTRCLVFCCTEAEKDDRRRGTTGGNQRICWALEPKRRGND